MTTFITIRTHAYLQGIACRRQGIDVYDRSDWFVWATVGIRMDLKLMAANDDGLNLIPYAQLRWR